MPDMLILLFFAFIPMAVAGIMKYAFHNDISWKEMVVQGAAGILGVLLVWGTMRYSDAQDIEIWNGSISNKFQQTENCPIGWNRSKDWFCTEYDTRSVYSHTECASRDDDGNCTSYRDVYETEYKYDYPWERKWFIESSNLDERWMINRVDRQGANTPPRWTNTVVGEPASKQNHYMNWILAASDSLFHEDGVLEEKYLKSIPNYPINVYDIYKIDRVITDQNIDIKAWDARLDNALIDLGPNKQMNAIIFVVDAVKFQNDYPYAVRRAWNGFKKNDAVVFVGVNGTDIAWTEVLSWSKDKLFEVSLRNDLMNLGTLDIDTFFEAFERNGQYYARRSMTEFEYLKAEIPIPTGLMIALFIMSIGVSLGLSFLFKRIDF